MQSRHKNLGLSYDPATPYVYPGANLNWDPAVPYDYPGTQPGWFGTLLGNLGNNWQGYEDQGMYVQDQATPYATIPGIINSPPAAIGAAAVTTAGNVAHAVTEPVLGFLSGMARAGGVVLGVAIIGIALLHEAD